MTEILQHPLDASQFCASDLRGPTTWRAMGALLRGESERLRADIDLVDRQIIEALPKLSLQQIVSFFAELRNSDSTIPRTILNAARRR
jgi:hypothetical protein